MTAMVLFARAAVVGVQIELCLTSLRRLQGLGLKDISSQLWLHSAAVRGAWSQV